MDQAMSCKCDIKAEMAHKIQFIDGLYNICRENIALGINHNACGLEAVLLWKKISNTILLQCF